VRPARLGADPEAIPAPCCLTLVTSMVLRYAIFAQMVIWSTFSFERRDDSAEPVGYGFRPPGHVRSYLDIVRHCYRPHRMDYVCGQYS